MFNSSSGATIFPFMDLPTGITELKRVIRPFRIPVLFLLLASLSPLTVFSQVNQGQVESRLRSMTPEEIDAKLKEMGMTREQAEARAKAMGVDVNAFLQAPLQAMPEVKAPAVELMSPTQTRLPADADVQASARPDLWYESPEGIPYFGYSVFEGVPSAFEPTAAGPADPEYLIGPEDGLRLVVWGQAEFQYDLTVDKEGRIFIPTVGQILVSGMTLEKATQKLLTALSRSYSGLVGKNPTVWMDLSISRLRPKRIFILGEVRKPGGYTVHSYATVFNSLYSVGGPTLRGSLREVRLVRNDKTVARVDLYDYFTGAETTNDFRVQTNDQIFVPIRQKTVTVVGEVKRPAIYELKRGETLEDALAFAGGFKAEAHVERIKIRRILPPGQRTPGMEERVELDVDYAQALSTKRQITLEDGDEVFVRSVLELRRNYVAVTGAVKRPGTFQLERFPTLRRVLLAADSLERTVYQGRAEVSRLLEDSTRLAYHFDLRNVFNAADTTEFWLEPLDRIRIYSSIEVTDKSRSFEVRGAVRSPGSFLLIDNTSVLDALFKAGGLLENADRKSVSVVRRRNESTSEDTLSYSITVPIAFWDDDVAPYKIDTMVHTEATFRLENRDIIIVRPDPKKILQRVYSVTGEVRRPGSFALVKPNTRVSDAISKAGGVLATGYLAGARLRRGDDPVRVNFELAVRNPSGDEDVVLQDGDQIYIPLTPNTVRVEGEVGNPGLYGFVRGRTMMDYIDIAGGLRDSAQYIYHTMPSGETQRYSTTWPTSMFEGDPAVLDGAIIIVSREAHRGVEDVPFDLGATVRDVMAILASSLTIVVLAGKLN